MRGGSGLGLPAAAVKGAVAACRVIVVASDELDRRRVVDVLERDGFDVSSTPSGTERQGAVVTIVVDPRRRGRLTANAPLVVISRNADRTAVDDALAAGATGFVPEADVEHRLAATVRAVAVGQLAIPNEHRAAVAHPILSPREKQVMSMVVLGFTNVEIASKLHVTETTVKSHLSSAYRKLRVRSRQEATALILSNKDLGLGILTLAGDRGVS